MLLNLDILEDQAGTLSFATHRRTADVLEIALFDNVTLVFRNFPEEDDNAFGFEATPWHTHDDLYWASSSGENFQFSPHEVLSGLRSGELVVASRHLGGELKDMWIEHVRGLGQFEFYETGEEFRARQLGQSN
jgi:hypothetical protein